MLAPTTFLTGDRRTTRPNEPVGMIGNENYCLCPWLTYLKCFRTLKNRLARNSEMIWMIQCSRLKFWYEFRFEGILNFRSSAEGRAHSNSRCQSKNIETKMQTSYKTCARMNYMVHVFSTMWRVKNQPSNSTSCSDNAPRLLVLVTSRLYWRLQVTSSSFSIWGCVLKGCFEGGTVYFEGPNQIDR